ncbi:BppU family phage baseplate upper protein, partial [Enterococcus thailandicus]|uniref:BppU family phage baseplate upper protein n=1 Tax=Enterococcus thailandicus TaxID=417368 RepID=UPI0039A654FE
MANSLYNIALDFSKELNYAKAIMARQGDKGVTVEVTPFLNGLAFPTSGVTFTLKATTPSGKYVDSKGTISSGIVKFSLDSTFMSESGYYRNCYVEASTSTQTLTTQDIIFFSLGVSDISQGQGKEYISRLEQLIEQYNKTFDSFMKEIADDAKDIQTQLTNMNNQAKALQTQLDELKAALAALDFQKQRLTADDGKSLRLADLNPRPVTIDDLTRPGFYYITSAESNTFIPADHYIRQIGMAGSSWIIVYPGDTGNSVVQEYYRNTANSINHSRHLYRKQESVSPITWNPWFEYAQTNSTMLSSSYYQGAAHRIAEATTNGKQTTSYLELSENTGI